MIRYVLSIKDYDLVIFKIFFCSVLSFIFLFIFIYFFFLILIIVSYLGIKFNKSFIWVFILFGKEENNNNFYILYM